jgi:hypothetical protein
MAPHTHVVLLDKTGRIRGLVMVPWGWHDVARRAISDLVERDPALVCNPSELVSKLPAQMLAEVAPWTEVAAKG